MIKFLVINIPFSDWGEFLEKNNKIVCIEEKDIDKYDNTFKILPLCITDYIKYNNYENNIFKNNLDNINILNNKCKFGKYMLNNFIDNISPIYYYNFDNETYVNNIEFNNIKSKKMIIKPDIGCAGLGINIVYDINNNLKNCIISKYIEHTEYFVGHFLVLNGIIYDKIYFYSNYKYTDGIKRGQILNYKIKTELNIDDSIFSNIFNNLSYSGFADSDFIINNDKIIIFEINPRPGGSLIYNKEYFNKFLDKLHEII